jgi:hypothetical protein
MLDLPLGWDLESYSMLGLTACCSQTVLAALSYPSGCCLFHGVDVVSQPETAVTGIHATVH